jgi:hypothetical protein
MGLGFLHSKIQISRTRARSARVRAEKPIVFCCESGKNMHFPKFRRLGFEKVETVKVVKNVSLRLG